MNRAAPVGRKRKQRDGLTGNVLAAPVTTPQERSLFFQLLESHNQGGKDCGWSPMTAAWNSHLSNLLNASADHNSKLLGIFPKTSFHLRSFYKEHTKQVQVQEALHFSPTAREAHAVLNRQLEEGFWGRSPSLQVPLIFNNSGTAVLNPGPQPTLERDSTVFSPSIQESHVPVSYTPPQVSPVVFEGRAPLQDLSVERSGSLRGGLGKGKVCKSCGKSRLGHPRKGCPPD